MGVTRDKQKKILACSIAIVYWNMFVNKDIKKTHTRMQDPQNAKIMPETSNERKINISDDGHFYCRKTVHT